MTSLARCLTTVALLCAVALPAHAQVPARPDATVWRGLELRWGSWTHRLGALSSYIATDSSDERGLLATPGGGADPALLISNGASGGDLKDPGGVRMTTYYSRYVPQEDSGNVAFWHLEGDELLLRGRYDCTEVANNELVTFEGEMVLGDGPARGFDATRIDPDGQIPDDFDRTAALLNGVSIDPLTPNGAHTVDFISVAIVGEPRYDLHSGALHVPLRVEYRPGCIPDDGYSCTNPVEGPRGADVWEVAIRPYLLVVAWNEGAGEEITSSGWLVDDAPRHACGDGQRVKLDETEWLPEADDPVLGGQPLLGFQEWGIYAGSPGSWYEEGVDIESCEHCAVALSGRHLRRFAFAFEQRTGGNGALRTQVHARWESDPFDGNPYAVFQSNPHWPEWSWTLWGLYLEGNVQYGQWRTKDRPALTIHGAKRLP